MPTPKTHAEAAVTSSASADRLPISVVILTHNEEDTVEDCLQSVAGWAGAVFVVDSGSTDGTESLVRRYTSRVFQHPFVTYAQQRNWAQESLPLAHEWVLHLDADERVSPELASAIAAFFRSPRKGEIDGLYMSRRTVFMGRWIKHGGHYPRYHLRLFRRDKGRCEDRAYDQHFVVDGTVARLNGDLIDVVAPDLTTWLVRHARWAGLEAETLLMQENGRGLAAASTTVQARPLGNPIERRRWLRNSIYSRAPLLLRAFALFVYRYVIRFGFLDGREGLIFHFLHGCWFRFYIDALVYDARLRERR